MLFHFEQAILNFIKNITSCRNIIFFLLLLYLYLIKLFTLKYIKCNKENLFIKL